MASEYETEPESETKLEWISQFARERIEPLDLIDPDPFCHPQDGPPGPSVDGLWPSDWPLGRREEARRKVADMLEHSVGDSSAWTRGLGTW